MPGLYIIVSAMSSFLLFLIQPIAAKTLLPVLGGAPAVWNTCMVFFQGMLLVGYLYAFMLTRYFSGLMQCLLHLVVMMLSLLMVPVFISGLAPLNHVHPIAYVLTSLFASIGLPLFVLTTTAPLVQSWFGHTDHVDASDPYFLYSASNVGSLVALLGFPFLFEPFLGRQTLSISWSILYLMFVFLLFNLTWQQRNHVLQASIATRAAPTWNRRGYWLLLSFAPSSLLLSVTQYITTNIASAPLFWILPLTLYLISFIIVFARKPIISHEWMVKQLPFLLVFPLLSFAKTLGVIPAALLTGLHLIGFFALTMVCIGELAAKKPEKSYLTEFYFWMALGGFLGGVFNSLIAPFLFNDIYEYYIAICLCVLLCPSGRVMHGWREWLFPVCLATVLGFAYVICVTLAEWHYINYLTIGIEIVAITIILTWHQRSLIFATNIAVLFIFIQMITFSDIGHLLWQSRNFFGVSRVYSNNKAPLHVYIDGVTMHGAQLLSDEKVNDQALTYYRPIFSVSDLLHVLKNNNKPLRVAVAGLGTGTLSCAFKADETTFFEINPTVINIANTPQYFNYLHHCPPHAIVAGDARFEIAQTKAHGFDVILIDTFTSDAIPTHLITVEAVSMYLQKLTQNGVLIFHISNSQVDLQPLLFAISRHLQLIGLERETDPKIFMDFASNWVVLTKNKETAAELRRALHWKSLTGKKAMPVWTDDYSNILAVLK